MAGIIGDYDILPQPQLRLARVEMIARRMIRTGLAAFAAAVDKTRSRSGASSAGARPRILFLQYETALGAAVNAAPVFEAVRRAVPNAFIAVAAAGLPYAILKNDPHIDQIIGTPDPHRSLARAAWSMMRRIARNGDFDWVVTDTGNMKTRIAVLALLSGARVRGGYTVAPELYNRVISADARLSVRQNNLRVATLFDCQPAPLEPRIYFTTEACAAAEALLARHGIDEDAWRLVFVTQTSGGQPSRWYDSRFAAVADRLAERYGASILFVGTGSERADIEKLRQQMNGRSVNLAGETDIPTLCALLSLSDLTVTLDTGTMHLARATGVPTVIVAAAWQPAHEWLPIGVPSCRIVRRNDIGCANCRRFVCATHECMDEISAADVAAAAEAALAEFAPSAEARKARLARNLFPGRSENRLCYSGIKQV